MTFADWLTAAQTDPYSTLAIAADWCADNDLPAEEAYLRHLTSEENSMLQPPFKVGDNWFVCTVTLYYVGRIKELGLGWVLLEDASWVHWTGRLSALMRSKDFTKTGNRRPRVEPCGEVLLANNAIVSAYPWSAKLPQEPIE